MEDKAIAIVKKYTENKEVTLDSDLVIDLELDELDRIEIGMELEEQFGVILSEKELQEARTVRDLVEIVRQNLT